MGIPEEIRAVERPKNTIVVANKTDGPRKYAVRERIGVRYVPGGNPQPINGDVIGYIYDGAYIPISDMPGKEGPDFRSYGAAMLAKSVSDDYLKDLMAVMDIDYAVTAYCAALLKCIKPGLKSKRMSTEYRRTFVGEWHPGVDLNKNAMTKLYTDIGMDRGVRTKFVEKRLKRVTEGHHLIIDGMLKQDTSIVNNLSGYSSKGRVKGIRNISLVYAYDLETMDIVCSEVFPGGYIDASAYASFIRDNNITEGILVTDKGFPPSKLSDELAERPKLHFLTPLKRNDTRIRDNNMMEFDGILSDTDPEILYRKVRIKGGKYLYSFRDPKKASIEEIAYLSRTRKSGEFDFESYNSKSEDFGTIVFLSDTDITPEQAYAIYSDRWLIELVFRFFKNDMDIETTDAQDDFAIIGEEFVNTIAAGITCRMMKVLRESGLLGEMSYGDILDDLSGVWRDTKAPKGMPKRDDRYWIHPFEYAMDEMVILGFAQGKVKTEGMIRMLKSKGLPVPGLRSVGRPPKNAS